MLADHTKRILKAQEELRKDTENGQRMNPVRVEVVKSIRTAVAGHNRKEIEKFSTI